MPIGNLNIMLDYNYIPQYKIIRFNCSECGALIFGVENVVSEEDKDATIDVVDRDAVLTCGKCCQRKFHITSSERLNHRLQNKRKRYYL